MKIANLGMNNLVENKGQIDGVPKNPRTISEHKFTLLKQSITRHPEMLSLRELLVVPHKNKFVVVGGNMRFKALKELGYTDAPCKIIDAETPVNDLRDYLLADNSHFGEWNHDELSSLFTEDEIIAAGIDIPIIEEEEVEIEEEPELQDISTKLIVECKDVRKLRELFIELQGRGFVCELK